MTSTPDPKLVTGMTDNLEILGTCKTPFISMFLEGKGRGVGLIKLCCRSFQVVSR